MAIPIAYIMSSSHDGWKGCKRTPSIIEERKLNVAQLLFLASVDPKADISLYLLYCWYMARRNMDNIGHTAHFWGAVYGLLFPLVCRPDIFHHFIAQLGL